MPIRYLVLGTNQCGQIVERWHLRSEHLIDVARADMYLDSRVKHVVVVSLCLACSDVRVGGKCLNAGCPTHVKWLEVVNV